MKNILFCCTIFTCLLTSCQSKETNLLDDSLAYEIVSAPVYKEYKRYFNEDVLHIVGKKYDLIEIGKILNRYDIRSICDFEESLFEGVKGGLQYKSINCKLEHALDLLLEKFPVYRQLSIEDHSKLSRLYEQSQNTDFSKTVLKEYLNRKK